MAVDLRRRRVAGWITDGRRLARVTQYSVEVSQASPRLRRRLRRRLFIAPLKDCKGAVTLPATRWVVDALAMGRGLTIILRGNRDVWFGPAWLAYPIVPVKVLSRHVKDAQAIRLAFIAAGAWRRQRTRPRLAQFRK